MPLRAWKEVSLRVWNQSWLDNIGLVAAGVAFYGFLALVPLLGILVLTYGIFARPDTERHPIEHRRLGSRRISEAHALERDLATRGLW